MRNGKGRVAALALAAVLGLGAAACSSSNETSTTSTTASAGSSGTSSTAPGTTTGTTKGTTAGTTPGTAMAGAVELQVVETPYGKAIGTADGLAVYTFDKEADGTIACVDACLTKWPAVLATEMPTATGVTGAVTLVDRPDGTKQVAIDGHAVYHMSGDTPGDASCQGVNGWFIVNPDGTKNSSTTPS